MLKAKDAFPQAHLRFTGHDGWLSGAQRRDSSSIRQLNLQVAPARSPPSPPALSRGVATLAIAAWLTDGVGNASGRVGQLQALTVSPGSPPAQSDCFPGGTCSSSPYGDAEKVVWRPSGDFAALDVIEVEALARAAKTEQEATLYRVAAFTGLRFGELRALRWRCVEFATANIHVRRNFPVHATREKLTKGKQVRSVPMFDQVARELDRLSRRGYLTEVDDLVFVSETGGHLDYEHVKDAFYEALAATGQGRVGFHGLRHSYGTMAVRIYDLPKV
jgi:integrase